MVRILTDSAADLSPEQARAMGVGILPLSIVFEGTVYHQEDDPGFHGFYQRLKAAKAIPTTSQATPENYLELFTKAQQAGDELVAITLSSGLSSTHESGVLAKERLGDPGIRVVDGRTAVMGQRILVDLAVRLRDEGKSAAEIERALVAVRDRVRVYGMLDTLEYLKKGGRVPPSAAMLGTLLNVKPVIIVKDGVVGMAGKARGSASGIKLMFERIDAGPAIDRDYPVYFGYADTPDSCEKFRAEAVSRYALSAAPMFPIGGVIGTHVGAGTIAIAYVEKE